MPLLSYRRLFDGCFQILSREEKDCASPDGRAAREFLLTLGLMHPLPKPIFAAAGGIALTGAQASATLSAPIFQGELRHFYPNYKDYYYLPAEDMAIHKSVAAYVDKDYRVKATAANCYVRREGKFLPQYGEPRFPCFFSAYKGKERYFEMTEEFFGSKEALKDYAMSLLSRLAETVR